MRLPACVVSEMPLQVKRCPPLLLWWQGSTATSSRLTAQLRSHDAALEPATATARRLLVRVLQPQLSTGASPNARHPDDGHRKDCHEVGVAV